MKNIVFILFYIIFLYFDIKKKSISRNLLIAYFVIGVILNIINYKMINVDYLIDFIYSLSFGFVILVVSVLSGESIGKGDGIYFLINSLYISFKYNLFLFVVGILTAFLISIFLMIINNNKNIYKKSMPFVPFLIPGIIMEVYLCIQ